MTMSPHKRLRPLIRSNHWDLLVEVLKERKESCIMQLLTCDPEDLKRLQGSVQELDNLLKLKDTLTAEEGLRIP